MSEPKAWMGLTMMCRVTGKDEPQYLHHETEDGVWLMCSGCGKIHGHEIGFFADLFERKGEP